MPEHPSSATPPVMGLQRFSVTHQPHDSLVMIVHPPQLELRAQLFGSAAVHDAKRHWAHEPDVGPSEVPGRQLREPTHHPQPE